MLFWVRQEDRRYYRAWLQKDLLGSICVFKSYGSLNAKQGRSEYTVCDNTQHAKDVLREIFRARKKQGFELFPESVVAPLNQHSQATPARKSVNRRLPGPDLFSLK